MIIAEKWAKKWVDAINDRDLDGLLSLYADNCEIRSPFAKLLTHNGSVKGKEEVRNYFNEAIRRMSTVKIDLIEVYQGHMTLALHHVDTSRRYTIETMSFDEDDKVLLHTACLDRVR